MLKKIISVTFIAILLMACKHKSSDSFQYKVGILGAPSSPFVEWNDHNLELMKKLGFNTMQLNIESRRCISST